MMDNHSVSQNASQNYCDGLTTVNIFKPEELLLSNEQVKLAESILDSGFGSIVGWMGIVTNILDITVFFKQGFKDNSVNVSLAAIAFWDLARSICGAFFHLWGLFDLIDPYIGAVWKNMTASNLQMLQRLIGYPSYAMAAYLSVERCLCITMPLKVKSIVTPKLTLTFMVAISIFVFGQFIIMLFVYGIGWVCSEKFHGRYVTYYSYNSFYAKHGHYIVTYYNTIGILNPLLTFSIMVVCTTIIYYQLQKSAGFRAGAGAGAGAGAPGKDQGSQMSTSERQVIKMLLVVILIYIIHFVPVIAQYIVKLVEPEFYFLKRFHNSFIVTAFILFSADLVNSSINFFIYMSMSTKFRNTFYEMFGCKKTAG